MQALIFILQTLNKLFEVRFRVGGFWPRIQTEIETFCFFTSLHNLEMRQLKKKKKHLKTSILADCI